MIHNICFPIFFTLLVFIYLFIIYHFLSALLCLHKVYVEKKRKQEASDFFVFASISISISSLNESLPPSPCMHPHLPLLLLPSSSPFPAAFFTSPCRQRRPTDQIGSPSQSFDLLPSLLLFEPQVQSAHWNHACRYLELLKAQEAL